MQRKQREAGDNTIESILEKQEQRRKPVIDTILEKQEQRQIEKTRRGPSAVEKLEAAHKELVRKAIEELEMTDLSAEAIEIPAKEEKKAHTDLQNISERSRELARRLGKPKSRNDLHEIKNEMDKLWTKLTDYTASPLIESTDPIYLKANEALRELEEVFNQAEERLEHPVVEAKRGEVEVAERKPGAGMEYDSGMLRKRMESAIKAGRAVSPKDMGTAIELWPDTYEEKINTLMKLSAKEAEIDKLEQEKPTGFFGRLKSWFGPSLEKKYAELAELREQADEEFGEKVVRARGGLEASTLRMGPSSKEGTMFSSSFNESQEAQEEREENEARLAATKRGAARLKRRGMSEEKATEEAFYEVGERMADQSLRDLRDEADSLTSRLVNGLVSVADAEETITELQKRWEPFTHKTGMEKRAYLQAYQAMTHLEETAALLKKGNGKVRSQKTAQQKRKAA